MISKKQFVEIIDRLRKVDDFVNEVNNNAKKLKDAIESDFFNVSSLSISHESIVVELLQDNLNDYSDVLNYWLYEKNYGREYEIGDISYDDDNGNLIEVDLTTPEKLYDYLTDENRK